MIKINLVPAEILAKARQKQQIMQASAVGIVALILIALASVMHYWTLTRLQKQYAYDQGQLKKLQVIVDQVEELEKTASAVRARLNVINDLLKGRPLYPRFMADFVRSVPAGVQVKTLTTSGGGSGGMPVKLSAMAQARTEQDIASWTRKLSDSGRFSAVELGAVTEGADGVYNFSLTSTYTPQL